MNENLKLATEEKEVGIIVEDVGSVSPADEKMREVKDWAKEPPNPLQDVTTEALLKELVDRLPNLALVGHEKDGKPWQVLQGQMMFLYAEIGAMFDVVRERRLRLTVPVVTQTRPIPQMPIKLR